MNSNLEILLNKCFSCYKVLATQNNHNVHYWTQAMKSAMTTNLIILYHFRQLGFQHRERWSIVGLLLPTLVHEVVSGIVMDDRLN